MKLFLHAVITLFVLFTSLKWFWDIFLKVLDFRFLQASGKVLLVLLYYLLKQRVSKRDSARLWCTLYQLIFHIEIRDRLVIRSRVWFDQTSSLCLDGILLIFLHDEVKLLVKSKRSRKLCQVQSLSVKNVAHLSGVTRVSPSAWGSRGLAHNFETSFLI